MIHPLLRLVASQPQLLAEHAQAYAALVGEDLGKTASMLKWQIALGLAALALAGVAVVLTGVALMLWAVSPPAAIQAPWLLLVVPGVPAALAAACVLASRRHAHTPFDALKQQVAADLSMLRAAGAA